MTFQCPICRSPLDQRELRVEFGYHGGLTCPVCNAQLRYWPPYHHIALLVTLPILLFALVTRGLHEGWFFSIKVVVLWFVGSIAVSVLISQIKPPILKSNQFVDKDAPPSMFDKRP
jgi:hypothetical protein